MDDLAIAYVALIVSCIALLVALTVFVQAMTT